MTLTSFWRHKAIWHYHNTKIAFSAFLMASSLSKVSIQIQTDINFCILLVYIFLRNVMVFDKEVAILYGFFNLRIPKKTLLEKSPNGPKTFFKIFGWCYIKMHIILYKSVKFYVFYQFRSILLVPAKYTLEN